MPKILITGSSGFLGSHLLRSAPDRFQIIAHYHRNRLEVPGKTDRFIALNLMQPDWTILEKTDPDIIIHTAAMASIDQCENQQDLADAINNRVSVRLARLASDRNIRYIFVSSDVIFDGKRGNYSEKDKPNPVNFYASTKINAEKEILKICKDAVIVRPALFYGTAFKGRPSFTEIMLKNLYAGRQVFVFSDQYRSPISVKDLAKSIWELADHHFCGIIHLGGPEKLSRLEMGYLLCQIFSLDDNLIIPIRSEEANLAASRPPDCSLDSSLAASLLKTNIQDYKSSLQLVFR